MAPRQGGPAVVPPIHAVSCGRSFRVKERRASVLTNPPSGTAAAGRAIAASRSVQGLGKGCVHHPLDEGRTTMATSAERMRALRERERRGLEG
jgi:hypothetical protein